MTIRILLADSHQHMRESMRALIDRQPGMEVVGEAENERTMLQLTGSLKPDVVAMDINMPDLNSINSARQIISNAPGVKLLILSMYSNPEFVDSMLKAGANNTIRSNSTSDSFRERSSANSAPNESAIRKRGTFSSCFSCEALW